MSVTVAIGSPIAGDPSGGINENQNETIIEGTFTLSGNYGTSSSHGDTVNFTGFDVIKSNFPPKCVEVFEQNTGAPLGYQYIFNPGSDQSNGKLQILGTAASGAATTGSPEYTQGAAYSSGSPSLNNAVLRFKAFFTRL